VNILLTWLWQGIVVAGLTTVALRGAPRASADTRHAAWWVALTAVLGIPLTLVTTRAAEGTAVAGTVVAGIPSAVALPSAPPWLGLTFAVAWALTVMMGVMRLAHRWHAARALVRRSAPFDAGREARLPAWSRARRTARRPAQLRICDDIGGACALGFRRPVILVGRQLAGVLDDAALDLIVLHEHAHLARRDDWLKLLQACVVAVVWWHPAVLWLSRRIDLDREAACDDYVLARTDAARRYASALLHAAGGSRRDALAVVPGAATRPSALHVRVAWLFDTRRHRGRPRPLAVFALTLPLTAVAGSPRLASLVVFVERAESVERAHTVPAPRVITLRPLANSVVESLPVEAADGDRGDLAITVRSRQAAPRDAMPTLLVSTRTTGAPPSLAAMVWPPPAEAEPVLRSRPRRSLSLGMGAQPVVPRPSPLLEGPARSGPLRQAPWQALATSSTDAARTAASAVADRAANGGLSLGRAFSRTGQAIAGIF
jgi:beta-lactamase regulating signal transducer with metallopeptidase domain